MTHLDRRNDSIAPTPKPIESIYPFATQLAQGAAKIGRLMLSSAQETIKDIQAIATILASRSQHDQDVFHD